MGFCVCMKFGVGEKQEGMIYDLGGQKKTILGDIGKLYEIIKESREHHIFY